MAKLSLLSIAVLLLLTCTTFAEITTRSIDTDPGDMILLDEFGFTNTGQVNISVNRIVIEKAQDAVVDPSRLGFVLVANKYYIANNCPLDSNYSICVWRFPELSPAFSLSCRVTFPGNYILSFANCAPPYTSVAVTVRTELYNLEAGENRNYLSSTITYIPSLFLAFTVVNISLLGFWVVFCLFNRTYVRWLHLLISLLLLVKALSLVCATAVWRDLRRTGTPQTWHLYVSRSVNLVLLSTVLVLIRSRLFSKLFSHKKENLALLIVISLQVLANILLIVNGEHIPLFTSDFMCGLCLMLTIVFDGISWFVIVCEWNRPSRENTDAPENNNVEDTNRKRKFCYFVILITLYVNLRCIFYVLNFGDPSNLVLYNPLEDITSLAFFMACLYLFMPSKSNEYLYTDREKIPRVTST